MQVSQSSSTTLTRNQVTVWTWLVSKGINNSVRRLSSMIGERLGVNSLDIVDLGIPDINVLLGGSAETRVGVHIIVDGSYCCHMMVLLNPEIALMLIDMQLEQPIGTTKQLEGLPELEMSVLGEMGNIMGSFFLNELSNATGLMLMSSTPEVVIDTVDAIFQEAWQRQPFTDERALVTNSVYSAMQRQIEGSFVVVPAKDFVRTIANQARV
jgi:chemotaxis protein CheC